ncbi:MAG: D-alanyl-D-alanine dipeptidase, partial [Alphaproteobacteria bacterium]|nr:D-alanyl-D-alanine dipeptidase [Alphaproteobacteria bacterium]
MALIEITPASHDIELALAYATADNVTGAPIYRRSRCSLHEETAVLLGRAAGLAAVHGLRLRVFDAFRPTEAQWLLWNSNPDPAYFADPRRGSP